MLILKFIDLCVFEIFDHMFQISWPIAIGMRYCHSNHLVLHSLRVRLHVSFHVSNLYHHPELRYCNLCPDKLRYVVTFTFDPFFPKLGHVTGRSWLMIIFIHHHMVANSNNSNIIIITIILILMHKKEAE